MEHHIYGSSRAGICNRNVDMTFDPPVANPTDVFRNLGEKQFEMGNHLGNVLVTVSDRKIAFSTDNTTVNHYIADVRSSNSYYSFGALQPGRTFDSPTYRYGFGGMEKDDETKGSGNSYTTLERGYDSRLGYWISTDPVTRVFESPVHILFRF